MSNKQVVTVQVTEGRVNVPVKRPSPWQRVVNVVVTAAKGGGKR